MPAGSHQILNILQNGKFLYRSKLELTRNASTILSKIGSNILNLTLQLVGAKNPISIFSLTNADVENWHKLSSTIGNLKIDKSSTEGQIFLYYFYTNFNYYSWVGVIIVKVKPV